ncbi:SDR family oxidoreductase [Amycolatopsis sp. CA-128772]|uniref:SDR family oxidoreductase n=1 Tax=Amycolatopsis sp. CA-128772 TaxID=2073159 RepID=UPI000CD18A5B|nr:SDR family oxidoreductase [Amycolatopsis sp. CA-128772]
MPRADQSRTPGREVFLTGATGFLGAFILAELMERTEDTVRCLVRVADERQATERIHAALAEFRIRPETGMPGSWRSRATSPSRCSASPKAPSPSSPSGWSSANSVSTRRTPSRRHPSRTATCKASRPLLHGSLEAGVVPDHDETLNISPVGFFSRALVHISLNDKNLGKTYHLANPAGEPLTDLYDRIRSFGYRIEQVPYETWRERMNRAVSQTSPACSALPLIPDHPAVEAARHPAIDCTRAFAALEGTGITCPPLDEQQVHQQLAYMVEVGFLPSPDRIEPNTRLAGADVLIGVDRAGPTGPVGSTGAAVLLMGHRRPR